MAPNLIYYNYLDLQGGEVNILSGTSYYVVWRTWQEDPATLPWPFWFLKQGETYKRRAQCSSSRVVNRDAIALAYERGDTAFLAEVDSDFIVDVVLASFVEGESPEHAQRQIKQIFQDAQIERCVEVDSSTQAQIQDLFESTRLQGSARSWNSDSPE